MSETLTIFGTQFSGVTGIKATNSSNQTLTYIIPQGSISITSNGNNIDVTNYATANVSVGSSLPTQHTVHFEFTDNTDADLNVYYSNSLIGTMITAYTPTTYNSKTVDSAELDGVEWYERPNISWTTIWDDNINFYTESNGDYPYCWISSLSSLQISVGDVYRITYANSAYVLTGTAYNGDVILGNPKYYMGIDDGSGVPFVFSWSQYGAWTGSLDAPNTNGTYYFKIEQGTTS